MKKHQQHCNPSLRSRLGQRAMPLASLSGAALLLSLGLLQTAAADPVVANVSITQGNTGVIAGTITDALGLPTGVEFSTPVAGNSTANVSSNTATSNATGNTSLPVSASGLSLDINGQPVIDLAKATLTQTGSGAVSSAVQNGTAIIDGVIDASGASATVTKNVFQANATGNQGVTSIGVHSTDALTLSTSGVQLLSNQTHRNGPSPTYTAAPVSATSATSTRVNLDGISLNNTATVTGNATRSQAQNNNASNSISLSGATSIQAATGATAALTLDNQQTVIGQSSSVTANTSNSTGVFVAPGALVSNGTFTVSDNQVSASAQRNLATNAISLAEGRLAATSPLFSLSSTQTDDTVGGSVTASTTTDTGVSVQSGFNLQATVSGNQAGAVAGVNSASNKVALGSTDSAGAAVTVVGDLANVAGTLSNSQTGASVVNATTSALNVIDATRVNGPLSVTANRIQASASGNQADNTFQALTHSADGLDVALTNSQTYSGVDIFSGVTSSASGTFGIVADSVPDLITPGDRPTTLTVSDNTLASQARVNTASNLASVSSTTGLNNSTMAVRNVQDSSTSANATSELQSISTSSTGDLISSNATVSGNVVSAQAMQNVATNALSVNANAVAAALPAAPAMADAFGVTASYGVSSRQESAGPTAATVTAAAPMTGVGVFSSAGVPANVVVTNNVISAVARANVADNQLQVSSTTTASNTSLGLGNVQISAGDTTALVTPISVGVLSSDLSASAPLITVSGNQLSAAASGNAASNALSVQAGTSLTADTSVPVIGAAPLNATAGYAVLNSQTNSGAIAATVESPSLGLQAINAMPGQSVAVTGNLISATAYGNHAVNSVALGALPGQISASAALVSSQLNSGNVSATISGTLLGANAANVNGSTTVASNQVSANAVGNMAISSMVVGSR